MLVLAGDIRKVRANVSGPLESYMPSEVLLVFQSDGINPIKSWVPGIETNTLAQLVVGQLYYVTVSADVTVDAFSDETDTTQANNSKNIYRVETTDNGTSNIFEFAMPNNSLQLFRVTAIGRDGSGYNASIEVNILASCNGSGTVTIEDNQTIYFFGDSSITAGLASGTITPQISNTQAAFIGTTKWAITIETIELI